jgi:hypothetical protein
VGSEPGIVVAGSWLVVPCVTFSQTWLLNVFLE